MDALERHVPRRSDPWPVGPRETVRLVGGQASLRELRGRSRLELALVVSVAIALVGSLGSLVIGPRMITGCVRSKTDTTKLKLSQIVHEALPVWSSEHGGKYCPGSLAELAPYMNSRDLNDSWGQPLELHCGVALPSGGATGWVRSAGEDGRLDTADDLEWPY